MKTKTHLLLLTLCFFAHCCTEKPDTLPPITTTGENTFGCLVDGEVFLGNWHGIFDDPVYAGFVTESPFYNGQAILVSGHGKTGYIGIRINCSKISDNSLYYLNDTSLNSGKYYMELTFQEYRTNSKRTGEFFLSKLDTFNYIISGTFWFDAVNKEGEIVEIRDGRFDIIY